MSQYYQKLDGPFFDYRLWQLDGSSNVWLRGPRPDPSRLRLVCAGGAQTFGRFCQQPFTDLLAKSLGCDVLNLGIGGAGPARFLTHRMLDLLEMGDVVVLQVVSGRSASCSLFRALEGGMYGIDTRTGERTSLIDVARGLIERNETKTLRRIIKETRDDYATSFEVLLKAIRKPTLLFWFAERGLDYPEDLSRPGTALGMYPQLIDRATFHRIAEHADAHVEVATSVGIPQRLWESDRAVDGAELRGSTLFNTYYPSPEMHEAAAKALDPVIRDLAMRAKPGRA